MAVPISASKPAGADSVWDGLQAIVGKDYLRAAGTGDMVAGIQPKIVLEPGTETELAAALRFANEAGITVIPRGGGTKLGWGNQPARADLIVSTARLNRIIEHASADLTVGVEAGCPIQKLQNVLAESGQQIAVDPLWPEQATVGGVLSTNDSGTLRIRYGGLRDLIIGATIALPDGTVASSGGKVVKNVAGFDLPKLVTGALGTLGVITRAVFRLHPLPRNLRSFSFVARDLEDANRILLAVLNSKLAYTGLQARFLGDKEAAVDVSLEGTDAGLAAQTEVLRNMAATASETGSGPTAWQARQELWSPAGTEVLAKFSVLPGSISEVAGRIQRLTNPVGVQWQAVVQATGLGWLRLDPGDVRHLSDLLPALRSELEKMGGSMVVLRRPEGTAPIDAWGSGGDAFPLMLRVKQQFDPRGTLNPGRFIGGI
ncbi:MAG: FAD-binding oxidoreductase [Verrucomicrobia bacterium]|nr:FAD-binding oxidoreductase [Verrucomicrobiota bacterium]